MTGIPTAQNFLNLPEPKHPAKFSKGFIEIFRTLLKQHLQVPWRYPEPLVLDPFAGVGTIHQLRPEFVTYGLEIEKEWADCSEFTFHCDSRKMPAEWTSLFDAVVTSPTYGNRMADHHEPGPCSQCNGEGFFRIEVTKVGDLVPQFQVDTCPKCLGSGKESSKRNTYRHTLGRPLDTNNTGMYQFTQMRYKELHAEVYANCMRVLADDGLMIVNISDHIRQGELMKVTEWHRLQLHSMGFRFQAMETVHTQRLGFGENHDARAENETILVFRKEKS
jgi:DNA modification methylase